MTNETKLKIDELRSKGLGYSKIANLLGITKNSVASYCKRSVGISISGDKKIIRCLNCGKPIIINSNSKPRKFCSDKCRRLYWKNHESEINKKTFHEFICPICGKCVKLYGKPHQKYCSLTCYFKARYGGKIAMTDLPSYKDNLENYLTSVSILKALQKLGILSVNDFKKS